MSLVFLLRHILSFCRSPPSYPRLFRTLTETTLGSRQLQYIQPNLSLERQNLDFKHQLGVWLDTPFVVAVSMAAS